MNKEICKKCCNYFYLQKNIVIDDNFKMVGYHVFGVCLDKEGNEIMKYDFSPDACKFIEKEMKDKDVEYCYELSCFNKMKPNKNCSCYAEHKISEWNK